MVFLRGPYIVFFGGVYNAGIYRGIGQWAVYNGFWGAVYCTFGGGRIWFLSFLLQGRIQCFWAVYNAEMYRLLSHGPYIVTAVYGSFSASVI